MKEVVIMKEILMNKKWLLVAIVVVGLALVMAVPALTWYDHTAAAEGSSPQVQVNQQPGGIWVTGTGEVSITPDIAILNLGVTSTEISVAQAQTKASEAMSRVMKALANSGIATKDIQTGYYNISQRTRWDNEKQMEQPTAYQVTNMLTVKVRDTAKAGGIIDAVVQAGGDLIRINGIDFSVEEPSKYYTEVREKAITAAKTKADHLAKLAGVTLGKPTYIAENAQYSPNYGAYSNVAVAVPAPAMREYASSISTGETKITLSIQVAYAIN
jgi:uncharacterized protein